MICQNCKERPAVIHVTKVINDERLDIHLCEKCAQKNSQIGYEYPFSINNFLAGLLDIPIYPIKGSQHIKQQTIKCTRCGLTFDDFKRNGKLGCMDCYTVFNDKLMPILKRLHGNDYHSGKLPQRTGGTIKVKKEIEKLRNQLEKVLKNEEYEKAAEIRDKIKELEKNITGSKG